MPIAACERLVLVVGPEAAERPYVQKEWQEALALDKCVNPIVLLDGRDPAGHRVDGYDLIPAEVRDLQPHAEDFRRDEEYAAHLEQLVRHLAEPPAPLGRLVAVPSLPLHYQHQPERLKVLRDLLLMDLRGPVVVTGAARRVGLEGMGGIGKSVLANALARDGQVRRVFPNGVFWIAVGQEPSVVGLQRQLAAALSGEALFDNVYAGKEALRGLLAGKAALLVLDNVWRREDVDAFDMLGPRCKLLVTTRDGRLVAQVAGQHYQVQLPSEVEALALLATAAGVPLASLPRDAHEVAAQCGRLPLALALCGGIVQAGSPWRDLRQALREHDLEFLADEHAAEPQHESVWRAMELSVLALPEDQRQRFAELAVFPAGERVPEAAILTLWDHTGPLDERHARRLLVELHQRSLVQRDRSSSVQDEASVAIGVHDLLHHFACRLAERNVGGIAARAPSRRV